jgi:hypothetical protein
VDLTSNLFQYFCCQTLGEQSFVKVNVVCAES